ncbi:MULTISPECIES: RNA polymerase sigma factor [Sphingobacterium]|uniref:RNA polymerase sigma factor n=1 Tax=Sphingobacterium TaxID=28453 RepID=UPI00257BBEA8|nr:MULTISPECIES: sigma-70 family RNA polymerase sigma factor [Sphingobacterium]
MKQHWTATLKGSSEAFESLYDLVYRELFAYGVMLGYSREAVKDGIQHLFLELWEKRDRLHDVDNIKSYLMTWLRRVLNDHRVLNEKLNSGNYQPNDNTPSHEALLIQQETVNETTARLSKALESLTPKQRQVIDLRFFQNMSYEQIASKTGNSQRTIYNIVYESVKILKEKK